MKIHIEEGLGYDDIALLPNFSNISSRKEVSTITKISKNKYIDIPIILSPMDTVSSVKSCIKINQIGGAGVLHRFMSSEEQAKKARYIKDQSNFCINAIGLKDFQERLPLISKYTDIFFFSSDPVFITSATAPRNTRIPSGVRKVVSRNALFRTRVIYSRCVTSQILCMVFGYFLNKYIVQ